MMTYSKSNKSSAEKTVRDIRRATRRNYSAQEKIRIVLEGLRGDGPPPLIWSTLIVSKGGLSYGYQTT